MSTLSSAPFSEEEIAAEGIKPDEYEEIVKRLGRHPNRAELGMFGVMWSEHCCYKNSRPLLKQFPTKSDRILIGPGENAGVVDMGDGLRVAFKIESHNHPSAIEPFQGAATGVGGILRDIFTMGARPIAILDSLRFGNLENPRSRQIFNGVVEGISHYGNCVGVPTVGGEAYFDPAYAGNPLVNAMAIGIMETPDVIKAGASGVGNPVLYVGSTTGRDGMGGASFASSELSEESQSDRPAVQVGDPFGEKSLIEACLEAYHTGAVVAAQDMGAAGLTCSTSEMAAKGGVGVELDLDRIPIRETGMVPYEFLLSESQERMLFVVEQGREAELIEIFQRWGLHAVVAGKVIAEPIVRILYQGTVAAEMTAAALAEDTPVYQRDILSEPPAYIQQAAEWSPNHLPTAQTTGIDINGQFHTWNQILQQLLDTPSVASKRWIYRQYDHQVQNNTIIFPGSADAAVIRLRGANSSGNPEQFKRGLAATTDCNGRYVHLDPIEGAKFAVAEAARNISCVGAEPIAITDNLNFGSPEKPVGYWQLASACRGIAEACEALQTPVTGGNVSLYNETLDANNNPTPIYPTPVIGMVGMVEDITQACQLGWQTAGDAIYLLGYITPNREQVTLGGSEYLATIHNTVAGKPPRVDLELEKQVTQACRHGIRQNWLHSAHDCAEGGLAVALAEACIASNLGATVTLDAENSEIRPDELLFAEGGARILVSVPLSQTNAWESYLQTQLGTAWCRLGEVTNGNLQIVTKSGDSLLDITVSEMQTTYENAIARRL